MEDAKLLTLLTAQFMRHPLLGPAKLGIAVEDRVAVLSGFAGQGCIKAIAELVALETPGIRAVANEIETTEDETWRYVDCKIAKKACDLMEWNSLTPADLRVRAEHGRLAIFGRVDTQERFDAITTILTRFSGARALDNNLVIRRVEGDGETSVFVTLVA